MTTTIRTKRSHPPKRRAIPMRDAPLAVRRAEAMEHEDLVELAAVALAYVQAADRNEANLYDASQVGERLLAVTQREDELRRLGRRLLVRGGGR